MPAGWCRPVQFRRVLFSCLPQSEFGPAGTISFGAGQLPLSYPTPNQAGNGASFSGLFVIGETGLELLSPSRCRVTKVLIVDDMEGVRRMLTYALEDDYNIAIAANGLEAIRVAALEHPDVIVMDLDMPVMDGVEATRRIKADPQLASIKVLAVSGQHNSEKSRLVQSACDAFIEKPFEVSDLVEAVRRLALK